MKKIIAGILALTSAIAFSACSDKTNSSGGASESTEATTAGETTSGDETTGGKLIMATEPGFEPYEYLDGTEVKGVDVDIAQAIADELGLELEIRQMNFDSALVAVQQGMVDIAAAGITVNDERREKMDFTINYTKSNLVIVTRPDSGITSKADITADTKIGVQQATTGDFYAQDELGIEPSRYTKYAIAAEDLKLGRIDAIIMDHLPAGAMAKNNEGEIVVLDEVLQEDEYAIAVQKGNQELLDKINPIIQKLIDDGKIEEFTLAHAA